MASEKKQAATDKKEIDLYVERHIRLLEKVREVAKEAKGEASAIQETMAKINADLPKKNEQLTKTQIDVVLHKTRVLQNALLEFRAGILEPLAELANGPTTEEQPMAIVLTVMGLHEGFKRTMGHVTQAFEAVEKAHTCGVGACETPMSFYHQMMHWTCFAEYIDHAKANLVVVVAIVNEMNCIQLDEEDKKAYKLLQSVQGSQVHRNVNLNFSGESVGESDLGTPSTSQSPPQSLPFGQEVLVELPDKHFFSIVKEEK